MGYQRDDRHGGDNRWRDRDERDRNERGHMDRERGAYRGDDDDRGFFNRAGDELRSWFGDDDAQRRREMDERRWERERGMTGPRDNDSGAGGANAGGWGNQRGESWNRDRPGEPGGWNRDRPAERDGRFTASEGGERGRRSGASDGSRSQGGRQPGGDIHDPHYSEWRRRQIDELDRDYDEYRREHQSKFEQEFGGWREKRASQRQLLGRVTEHMEVVGSDGAHVGTVDKVRGDRIVLAKSDPKAGGMHHSVPCGWVDKVEDKVILDRSAQSATDSWRNEDNGRALFEREDQGSEGPHALDRSFSGTYGRKNDD